MDSSSYNQDLLAFLAKSPTPFHAVEQMKARLAEAGFVHLKEGEPWDLKPGKYTITRNGSSLIGLVVGEDTETNGIRLVGAHTDSPCLKVKPQPDLKSQGFRQLGVEVYGGALLAPWFDRDLSLAGRISYQAEDGSLKSGLVNFEDPIAVIPSLAIHLNREANSGNAINAQTDIVPVLGSTTKDDPDFRTFLLDHLKDKVDGTAAAVLDFELFFYDTQAPALTGLNREFVASARLDNLLSCFVGMEALLAASGKETCILVANDHEEVGSASTSGACGPFLRSVLERLCPSAEQLTRVLDKSMLVSADNAHAIHPNFAAKHDGNHGPKINGGPVIKVNANQRYATNSETAALFRHLCGQVEVPVQTFVSRTDMACGSTIGPLTATEVGVKTMDVGIPQFAMHSPREMCGSEDPQRLTKVLEAFYNLSGPIFPGS